MRQNLPGFAVLDPAKPVKLPLEARDFGIYAGFLVTWLYLIAIGRGRAKGMPPPFILLALVLFVFVMGADGFNAFFYDLQFYDLQFVPPHLYTPRLELRLGTGLLCGAAFAGILLPIANYSLWSADDQRPIIANWKQLLGALMVLAVLFAMNASEIGIFLYPLSILASASVLILLAAINFVFVLSFFQHRAQAVTWHDALNPFAIGVFLAVFELGALSALRYAILGTAVLP